MNNRRIASAGDLNPTPTTRSIIPKRLVAGLGLGLVLVACTPSAHQKAEKSHRAEVKASLDAQRLRDAVTVAQRYVCRLTSVVDTGMEATDIMRDRNDGKRTIVRLALDIKDDPALIPLLKRYDSDDLRTSIDWFSPAAHAETSGRTTVDGALQDDGTQIVSQDQFGMQTLPDDGLDYTGTMKMNLYPRTNYNTGAVANVIIANHVDTNAPGDKELNTYTGYEACGAIKFDGEHWRIANHSGSFLNHTDMEANPWISSSSK